MSAEMKDVEACVYLLHYKGKPIHIVQSSKRYAAPRLSKRVYFSEKDAKIGIRNLTVDLDESKIEIVRYVPEVAQSDGN